MVILDFVGVTDLDYTGSRALGQVFDQLDHIQFVMARASAHLRTSLDRSGLLSRISADHLYPTVDEAITARA